MHPVPKPPRKGWHLKRPQGSAIIVALLAVALVAGMASVAINRAGAALDMAQGRQDHAQARQLALSAIELARLMLADDARNTRTDWHGELWAQPIRPSLHRDARVSLQIADMTGHFDLNALIGDGRPDSDASSALIGLLQALGADAGSASQATAAVHSHLRKHGLLPHIDAVRTINQLDPKLAEHLIRVAVALPARARLNINTAPAVVLAASLPGLSHGEAVKLAQALRTVPAAKAAELAMLLPDGVRMPDIRHFDVRSDYFLADVVAVHGVATVQLQALLTRSDDIVHVAWIRLP
ncbi:MAG: type II secretion system minor pseudopilin GspK [Azoarcus sp.]|nr:type II secretion system minor pseudopilin GspK [Azoarcus sp.]